jgi:hypothetical protein
MPRVLRADNLTTIWADCLDNVGSLTSHNPIDLQGLFTRIALFFSLRERLELIPRHFNIHCDHLKL